MSIVEIPYQPKNDKFKSIIFHDDEDRFRYTIFHMINESAFIAGDEEELFETLKNEIESEHESVVQKELITPERADKLVADVLLSKIEKPYPWYQKADIERIEKLLAWWMGKMTFFKSAKKTGDANSSAAIVKALQETKGNVMAAAQMLAKSATKRI